MQSPATASSNTVNIPNRVVTYTEYSPSKLCVHILTQATLEGAGRKRGNVEMYATERYFTLTTELLWYG